MRFSLFQLNFVKLLRKMFEKPDKATEKLETIQDIAIKLVEDQLKLLQQQNGSKESTIFVLGSKGVGKSSAINKFFDREDQPRPTLALEYSYGRRTASTPHSQKQVLNMWELGSLENAEQLIEVPLRTHGIENFAAIIMVDLSRPQRIWLDLEMAYQGLKECARKMIRPEDEPFYRHRAMERVKKDHLDMNSLDLMPFPVVLVGGKYDLFQSFDPELKKHICRCLRSMAHLMGASLLFHSSKNPKLSKTLRDTISHLGFASPTNPFRGHTTDYNDALSIWFGTDSWERIGLGPGLNVHLIGHAINVEIPQMQPAQLKDNKDMTNPAKDPGFHESIIDEMRAQKDEELASIIRESNMREHFETVAGET